MKEKDLVELGMKRYDVSAEESGVGAYHYYSWDPYKQSSFALLSSASDDKSVVKKGEWVVQVFDDPDIEFKDTQDVRILMDLLVKNLKKKRKRP